MLQRSAAGVAQPPGARAQVPRDALGAGWLTQRPSPGAAGLADATRGHEAEHHVVTLVDSGHALAERGHHPRALMAEHDRPAAFAELAVGEVHVGVADPGGRDADEDLARPGRIEQHGLDRRRAAGLTQDAGAHLKSGPGRRSRQCRVGHPWAPRTGGVVAHELAAVKRITNITLRTARARRP